MYCPLLLVGLSPIIILIEMNDTQMSPAMLSFWINVS